MKYLKTIIGYLLWLLLSILLGMASVFVAIGLPKKHSGFWTVFNGLDELIIFYLGLGIGVLAFILFLPINYYYITLEKWQMNKITARFLLLLVLVSTIKISHYIWNMYLDWI